MIVETYFIVAEERLTKRRRDISGELLSHQTAEIELERLNREMKKTHRYFRIAKYPYRSAK